MAFEAVRLATKYMTPVLLLSDSFLANGTEPWRVVSAEELPDLRLGEIPSKTEFAAYRRDPETLARPWVAPGTPGLEHRIGGLEKQDVSGAVSYDGANHQQMLCLRAEKVARIAQDIPLAEVTGPAEGELLVVGWGSSYGAIAAAVAEAHAAGLQVAHLHLRHLNPFPANLGTLLTKFRRVLVPENNMGQLCSLLRDRYLVDAVGLRGVQGRPFRVGEIREKIEQMVGGAQP
jgi:2-oxoglutarate ferredoxin oxidoreductase subunit alpha